MDREPDRSYRSPHVLGKMYRLIEPAPEYQPSFNICIDKRITSKIVSIRYLQAAGMMKQNVAAWLFCLALTLLIRIVL
jgi:hypothetical protein